MIQAPASRTPAAFRTLLVLALVCVNLNATVAEAAQRRRSARHPAVDQSPESWLRLHAWPLQTAELIPSSADLEPLRTIVGDASVVALAEATHGTHEFHTVRMRMIDFLVREAGFDVVIMEAPFPLLNRVNAYIQGAADQPQQILDHAYNLGYYFWDVREMLDLFAWARLYNAQRGSRPLLEFAGADTYDHQNAAAAVVSYLRAVDPVMAARAEKAYSCLSGGDVESCRAAAQTMRDELVSRETELLQNSSTRSFGDALQHATVVQQYLSGGIYGANRDLYLAQNTLWLRGQRGSTGRVIVWAHQEHAGKTPIGWIGNQISMGGHLHEALGREYVVIGTATGRGSFLQWQAVGGAVVTSHFNSATAGGYEAFFARGGSSPLLIPLQGTLPDWLHGPRTLQSAPANPSETRTITTSLPDKLDAIIYFESTTPARLE